MAPGRHAAVLGPGDRGAALYPAARAPPKRPRIRPADRSGCRRRQSYAQAAAPFAFLKHCHRLHDTQVPAWAKLFDRPDLPGVIVYARRAGAGSQRRFHKLHERSNHAFAVARLLEEQLLAEPEAGRRCLLLQQLRRVRRTAANVQAELHGVPVSASNRQIADLLGIPKGTVDTGNVLGIEVPFAHGTPSQ